MVQVEEEGPDYGIVVTVKKLKAGNGTVVYPVFMPIRALA